MINVILVEDEMLVLLGMKMCIQESGKGMRVLAAFHTAEDAVDFFSRHTADVLVTDIRLTGMSGLELIEKIKPSHKHMAILVLSCYEDFSYARRAYELGVDKYILKHELVEDELAEMIFNIYHSRKEKFTHRDSHIMDYLDRLSTSRLIRENGHYYIGLITMRGEINDSQLDDNDIHLPVAAEIIQEMMNRDCLGECFLRHNNELFCIFSLDNTVKEVQTKARLQSFFDNMSKNIWNYFNRYAYMTVSKGFTDLNDLIKTFEKVKTISCYTFYLRTPCILWVENQRCHPECPDLVFRPQNIFSDPWMAELKETVQCFFKTQKDHFVNPDEVKIKTVKYVNEFSSFLKKYYELNINDVFSKDARPDYFNINGFKNADGLRNWLIMMVNEVKDYILVNKKKETLISKIVAYAEENYNTDISLSLVAEKFHMNAVYICQLFKKNTGVTFIYYINNLRIEKAKSLLLSTDMTAEQVAEQVGIKNINYFFRLFKKSTGQTINQFKKNIQAPADKN